ncbi:MAG: serine protease DegS [Acidimicrobiales bacterium]
MAAEENDPELNGPPPDPSVRQWRHPSEVAAANAAAARAHTPLPPARRRWSPLSFGAGGVLGAVMAVAAVAASTSAFDSQPSSRIEFRPVPATAAESETPPVVSDLVDAVETGMLTTTTLALVSSTGANLVLDETEPPAEAGDNDIPGVVGLFHLDGVRPIATGVFIDGLLLTSASSLDGAERVLFSIDGHMREALVEGSDAFTDVAVLSPLETLRIPEAPAADDSASLHDLIRVVATDGRPPQIQVVGSIISVNEVAATVDGHPVIDTMYTTARLPQIAAGAALVNEQDEVIGLIINSDDYLAVAIPLADARAVGRSIMESGWPSTSWIGIEGQGQPDGVIVTNVETSGPAAQAGLAVDDRIVSINKYAVGGMADLVAWSRTVGVGGELQVVVISGDREWTTTVVVGHKSNRPTDS